MTIPVKFDSNYLDIFREEDICFRNQQKSQKCRIDEKKTRNILSTNVC